jgi:hypothetical protein
MNIELLVSQKARFPRLTWAQHGLLHGCSATEAREAWLEATGREEPTWWWAARSLYAEGQSRRQISETLGRSYAAVKTALWRMV